MLPDQDNHNTITYKQQKQKFIISLHLKVQMYKSTLDESSYLVKYNFTKHIGVVGPKITVCQTFPCVTIDRIDTNHDSFYTNIYLVLCLKKFRSILLFNKQPL